MLKFNKEENYDNIDSSSTKISKNTYGHDSHNYFIRESSASYKSFCIKCVDKRCQKIPIDKIRLSKLGDFSYDMDDDLCPVEAIHIEDGIPSIDAKKCILCGLCIANCPIGAIGIKDNEVYINRKISPSMRENMSVSPQSIKEQMEQAENYLHTEKIGVLIKESPDLLREIQRRLKKVDDRYRNKIVRNLLIGLGCKATTPRRGDVASRMDGIYDIEDTIGTVEVEFGSDSLSTIRGILDDIAILQHKYRIDKSDEYPLAVLVDMPNLRQDYWNVIKDVKDITNIRINTITVIALMILLWNRGTLNPRIVPYYVDYDNTSIRNILEKHLGRMLDIPERFLGLFEPEK